MCVCVCIAKLEVFWGLVDLLKQDEHGIDHPLLLWKSLEHISDITASFRNRSEVSMVLCDNANFGIQLISSKHTNTQYFNTDTNSFNL